MKLFLNFISKYKYLIIAITSVLLIAIVIMPIVINLLFKIEAPFGFLVTEWNAADMLSYYGSVLTFIGTAILSALALWQNHVIKLENEKHTYILEQMERNKILPLIRVTNICYSGNTANISFEIENVSDNIATDIKIFDIKINNDQNIISWETPEIIYCDFLKYNESKKIDFCNPSIKESNKKLIFKLEYFDILNFKHIFEFSCLFDNNTNKMNFIKYKLYS